MTKVDTLFITTIGAKYFQEFYCISHPAGKHKSAALVIRVLRVNIIHRLVAQKDPTGGNPLLCD